MKKYLLVFLYVFFTGQFLIAQKNIQTRWQNRPRNAIVYLPRNFNPSENLPLVINMHGFLTTSQFQFDYTQFHKLADTARCIVIYPDGIDLRWNSGTFFFVSSTVDDVGFLGDWMDRAAVLYNADLKKVYSMGYSAGGFMSYKLACDATNRVAAIAPNVASMVNDNLNTCVPARPINIAAFNGLSDPITPYTGIPGNFPGIDSIKHFWQIKNNCDVVPQIDTLPDIRVDGTKVVRYSYRNCGQQIQQVFYKVINGGHVWPGAANIFFDVLGKTTLDISMNSEAWNFFKTKEIPEAVRCNAPQNLQSNQVSVDSFLLSWNSVAGVTNYKIGVADDSSRVTFYETSNSSIGVKINPMRQLKWNVASLCTSGYHSWNTSVALNAVPTGIKMNTVKQLSVFPNPCSNEITVDFPKQVLTGWKITVFNLLGETVPVSADFSNGNKLDISTLEKGWYQLFFTDGTENYSTSFIKQ